MFDSSARSLGSPVVSTTRYRCNACGNITRFDVLATRRTRAFHHYTIGGDLEIEEEEVLSDHVEQVTCRWCSATGDKIAIEADAEPA
jgi:hypothetical protein